MRTYAPIYKLLGVFPRIHCSWQGVRIYAQLCDVLFDHQIPAWGQEGSPDVSNDVMLR